MPHRPLSLLVVTTSGGGGHLQAANAKIAEEQVKNPDLVVITHDILAHAGGKRFGRFMINRIWDSAQRKGSVRALEFWAHSTPIFDILFWIPVFCQILRKLFRYEIANVIDTQPLALGAMLCAIRIYNVLKKKSVAVEKILTDLPTQFASPYLSPIKRLSASNRALIHLVTTKPLLLSGETEEKFWKKHCNLSLQNISYAGFPIRPSFKKYAHQPKAFIPITLHISYKTPHEKTLLAELTSSTHALLEENSLTLTMHPQDQVTTLMLGSQPVQEASLSYVKTFIDLVKSTPSTHIHHYLFVFCAHKKLETMPLQERIYSLVTEYKDFPKNLTVLPMSSQTDDVIAPLYFRSNATLTKEGGITPFELLAVAQGKVWIHHEHQKTALQKALSHTPLLSPYKGMPKWEYGNALYLQTHKKAEMVSPDTFSASLTAYLHN